MKLNHIYCGKAGDYLIKGIKGELYICEEDIFYQTYELINTLKTLEAKKE